MPTTAETIETILIDKFGVRRDAIRPEATLTELGLDSLDLIEVLFEVEEAFNIRVPQDGAAIRASTLQELLDTVTRLVEEEHAAPKVEQA